MSVYADTNFLLLFQKQDETLSEHSCAPLTFHHAASFSISSPSLHLPRSRASPLPNPRQTALQEQSLALLAFARKKKRKGLKAVTLAKIAQEYRGYRK